MAIPHVSTRRAPHAFDGGAAWAHLAALIRRWAGERFPVEMGDWHAQRIEKILSNVTPTIKLEV